MRDDQANIKAIKYLQNLFTSFKSYSFCKIFIDTRQYRERGKWDRKDLGPGIKCWFATDHITSLSCYSSYSNVDTL